MDLSFQEKSLLGSLLATIVVFGIYFFRIFARGSRAPLEAGSVLGLMVGTVIALIVIQVVLHALLAATGGETKMDERDKLIRARAGRNSGIVLGVAVITTIMVILVSELSSGSAAGWLALGPLAIAQVLLAQLIVAQAAEFLSQLFYYRRGI